MSNLRIIIAGQLVPEASVSLATICQTHELLPIKGDEPFFVYCRDIGIDTNSESGTIREIIRDSAYNPGFFVTLLQLNYKSKRS